MLDLKKVSAELSQMEMKLEQAQVLSLSDFSPKDTLVFSIDMNMGFVKNGSLSSPRVEIILPQTASFLRRCEKSGFRVLPVTDCHEQDSPEFAGYPVHCLSGNEESKYVPELDFLKESPVPKNSTNAFFALDIPGLVGDYSSFIITGCCTDICIYQFAVALKTYCNQCNIETQVVVPQNLVETYDAPGHPAELMNTVFLSSMTANGIQVVKEIR